jgi:hypothetical protein
MAEEVGRGRDKLAMLAEEVTIDGRNRVMVAVSAAVSIMAMTEIGAVALERQASRFQVGLLRHVAAPAQSKIVGKP